MTPEDFQTAKNLKDQIAPIVPLIDFRIFGSRARGDMVEGSDMDIFIETPFINKALEDQIFEISWEIGFERSMVISIFILTKDKFEKALSHQSPIILNILREGIAI